MRYEHERSMKRIEMFEWLIYVRAYVRVVCFIALNWIVFFFDNYHVTAICFINCCKTTSIWIPTWCQNYSRFLIFSGCFAIFQVKRQQIYIVAHFIIIVGCGCTPWIVCFVSANANGGQMALAYVCVYGFVLSCVMFVVVVVCQLRGVNNPAQHIVSFHFFLWIRIYKLEMV